MQEFSRYLRAKTIIDDKSLNWRVLAHLQQELKGIKKPTVVDVGAGIGTGLERLLDWDIINTAHYTAIDLDPKLMDLAKDRLNKTIDGLFLVSSLSDFASNPDNQNRFDLVMAHAFLDIVNLEESLKSLVQLACANGLLYFPITFDGESIFEPKHSHDTVVLSEYHNSMCEKGNSKTGRKFFHALRKESVEILEMGSSDWIVYPTNDKYQADERFFLNYIVMMIEKSVGKDALEWAISRRQDIDKGRLVYIAHQIDCLARKKR